MLSCVVVRCCLLVFVVVYGFEVSGWLLLIGVVCCYSLYVVV